MNRDQRRANAFIKRLAKALPRKLPNPHAPKPKITPVPVVKVPSKLEEDNTWQAMQRQEKQRQRVINQRHADDPYTAESELGRAVAAWADRGRRGRSPFDEIVEGRRYQTGYD